MCLKGKSKNIKTLPREHENSKKENVYCQICLWHAGCLHIRKIYSVTEFRIAVSAVTEIVIRKPVEQFHC